MDKLRSIVKSFMVGMGVYILLNITVVLRQNLLNFHKLILMAGAAALLLVLSYLLMFYSEKFVGMFYKGEQWERKEDSFYFKSMFGFILFFALLRLPDAAVAGFEQIGLFLGMLNTFRDYTIYNEWNMADWREIANWVKGILIILVLAAEIFIILRTDVLVGMIAKSERCTNDEL